MHGFPPNMPPTPADCPHPAPAARQWSALRAIAAYKFVKTAACLLLAAAAFHLVRPDVAAQFDQWLESLTWATRHGGIARLVDQLAAFGPTQFRLVGVAAVVYMVLYAVQGTGLWLGKRWAEYLVVIETGLLLPFEAWELAHRLSALKLLVFAANILIVLYLVRVLRAQGAADRAMAVGE